MTAILFVTQWSGPCPLEALPDNQHDSATVEAYGRLSISIPPSSRQSNRRVASAVIEHRDALGGPNGHLRRRWITTSSLNRNEPD